MVPDFFERKSGPCAAHVLQSPQVLVLYFLRDLQIPYLLELACGSEVSTEFQHFLEVVTLDRFLHV